MTELKIQDIRDICARLEQSRVNVANGESLAVFPASLISYAMKEADELIAESAERERELVKLLRQIRDWPHHSPMRAETQRLARELLAKIDTQQQEKGDG